MLSIKEYVTVKSLEEAYELNKGRTNRILGGTGWLKLQNININKAIDLSALSLDRITEDEEQYTIGCMTTLRDMEIHKGLNEYTHGAIKECTRHIVGVQFRNCVTIGGSIFGRYGFSDVLTCLLALDTYVELYKGGIVELRDFINMKKDNDILVNVIIKKSDIRVVYSSFRNQSTDFPVLTCAVAVGDGIETRASIGARPFHAILIEDETDILESINDDSIEKFAEYVSKECNVSGNMRGSEEYRSKLVKVLTKRNLKAILEEK